jgi:hypothetical protein
VVIQRPFEVVVGTTPYYETDGKQAESNLHLPKVQLTVTTSNSLPSTVSKQKLKLGNEPTSVPPAVVSEPSISAELMGAESVEIVMLETRPLEVKVAETVRKTERESDEKKSESVFVADKIETKSVTGKEIESDMQHKQVAQNIEHKSVDSVDKTKRGTEVVEDKREIFEEPV